MPSLPSFTQRKLLLITIILFGSYDCLESPDMSFMRMTRKMIGGATWWSW